VNVSVPVTLSQKPNLRTASGKYPRSRRLLRHGDFDRVYKQGRRHFSANMVVFYLRRKETSGGTNTPVGSGLRVGFTVGRALGGAVERNRMKRRLREAVRLSWPAQGVNADIVINPKKTVLTEDFETLLNEVRRAFVGIEQKLGTEARDSRSSQTRSLQTKSSTSGARGKRENNT
jgi:ribonuclease P protein component